MSMCPAHALGLRSHLQLFSGQLSHRYLGPSYRRPLIYYCTPFGQCHWRRCDVSTTGCMPVPETCWVLENCNYYYYLYRYPFSFTLIISTAPYPQHTTSSSHKELIFSSQTCSPRPPLCLWTWCSLAWISHWSAGIQGEEPVPRLILPLHLLNTSATGISVFVKAFAFTDHEHVKARACVLSSYPPMPSN